MTSRTIHSSVQILLSLVGSGIAGFLYREHITGSSIPCINGSEGCNIVDASHWSSFHGIPVSLFGVTAYVALLFCAVIKLTADSEKLASRIAWLMLLITSAGVVVSWIYQYIAKFLIGAFCIWCRSSAITMTLLFIVALVEVLSIVRLSRKGRELLEQPEIS